MSDIDLKKQRENYFEGPEGLEKIMAAISASGLYATRKLVFDFSHWQSKTDGTTSVDWDGLAKYPQVAGAYCKLGEVGNTGASFDLVTDNWMDSAFDSSMNGLYRNKMWMGAYLYVNCGWPIDRGWTIGGFDACHERGNKTEDQHANDLFKDPNIYITVRKLKLGAGRSFDAAKIKSLGDVPIDKLVGDVEDLYLNNSAPIGAGWIARTYAGWYNGITWLMEHGYMRKVDIWTYSSRWVIDTAGGGALATVLETHPSIVAGYYWNNTIINTTVPELVSKYIASIPNNWTPRLFGFPKMYQVAANFTLPEVDGRTGRPSAVDVNVLNMSDAEFDAINPDWVKRRGAVVPEPEPEPEPEPKRYYAVVKGEFHNVRQAAGTVGVKDIGDLTQDARVEIEPLAGTVDGYRWGKVVGGAYIALTGNVEIVEE